MRLECLKYKWDTGTEDIDINFFSDVEPTALGSYDLYDYYVDETMSEVEYSFEDVDNDNTLYLKTSNLQFKCYDDSILIDFFECYTSSKYFKWKLNYYEDDTLVYSGVIYKDGVSIESVEDKILSVIVIGYEREFKERYQNVPLVDNTEFHTTPSGVAGLKYHNLGNAIYHNFLNVDFKFLHEPLHFLNSYRLAEKPFTYMQDFPGDPAYTKFKDYSNVLHLKTGYLCYKYDNINSYTWLDSILKPMGWIWYYYLSQLVIQERAATDYAILEIDCEEVEVSQSLKHNYNQFQVDNVIIEDGKYFDGGSDRSNINTCFSVNDRARGVPASDHVTHTLAGNTAILLADGSEYVNQVRPFRAIRYYAPHNYQLRPENHTFTRLEHFDEYNITVNKTYLYRLTLEDLFTFDETKLNYNSKKTLSIKPYINSDDNSGGLDVNNVLADTGAYYGKGNFFKAANLPVTNTQGFYNGSAANSIFSFDADTLLYINYEMYAQSDKFKRNFKKFLKTNDEVIIQIEVKQLITNPLQTIRLVNYQDADFTDKTFSIINLSFHPIDKISTLTLQMIN